MMSSRHGLLLLALIACAAIAGVTAPLGAQTAAPPPPAQPAQGAQAPVTPPAPEQPAAEPPAAAPATPAASAPVVAPPIPSETAPATETLAPATPAPAPKLGLFHRHPKGQAWVDAANPLAVQAGIEILAQGGEAVDTPVAVQTMLGRVEPQSSGIAGGAFMMYYDAGSREVSALDGREKAPAAGPANMFLDEHGTPLPFLEAVRSGPSTGLPGVFD